MRVVLLDASDNLLLVLTRDPLVPQLQPWWELPGGGLAAGEDLAAAAVREVAEESGLTIAKSDVSTLRWRRSVRYLRHGELVVQGEAVVACRVAGTTPPLDRSGLTPAEQQEVVELRWWPRDELARGGPFWPARLPELLESALDGEVVVESVEDRTPPRA